MRLLPPNASLAEALSAPAAVVHLDARLPSPHAPEALGAALLALYPSVPVAVSSERRAQGGLRWRVTFLDARRDFSRERTPFTAALNASHPDGRGQGLTLGGDASAHAWRSALAVSEEEKGAFPMVQRVTVRSRLDLGGTFVLGHQGRTTRPLPFDASPYEVSAWGIHGVRDDG